MQLSISFIIFTIICLILTYYFNLFISQSVYSRSELSNIIPQLGNIISIISGKYSILYLIGFYIISGVTGILILSIFKNWFFNSAIIPVIFYYSGPHLAIYFEQTRVTITENYKDIAESFYTKYYNYILAGFFSGYAVKLIDNWINLGYLSFFWFVLNFFIITTLTVLTFRSDIFD